MSKCLPHILAKSNLGKQLGLTKDTAFNTIAEIKELIDSKNNSSDIYSKLTKTDNVKIIPFTNEDGSYKDMNAEAKKENAVNSLYDFRKSHSELHFGNKFSSVERLLTKHPELQKTNSTEESVRKYIDWVINSKENRAVWIRKQLDSGILKGKKVLYTNTVANKNNEISHADALSYLINNWESIKDNKTTSKTSNQSTKQTVNNQEGIDFVFEQNPELAKIGSKEQYAQYLSQIFPNSLVKEIVYHSRFNVENIKNKDRWKNGFYSGTKDQAGLMAEMAEDSSNLMVTSALLIDIKNPKITDYSDRKVEKYENVKTLKNKVGDTVIQTTKLKYKEVKLPVTITNIEETDKGYTITLKIQTYNGVRTENVSIENGVVTKTKYKSSLNRGEFIENNNSTYNFEFETIDSFIIKATEEDALQLINGRDGYNTDNFKEEYVVFEPSQIHILGSKQDQEGFKEFVEQPIQKEIKEDKLYKNYGIKGIEVVGRYSESDVKSNRNKIYVFGDNTKRIGTGGQAIIRNNVNAVGIATKLAPSNDSSAFMSDNDFEKNKEIINKDIEKLIDKSDEKTIIFPKDGIGTGLAKLKEKAPKTYEYLKSQLLEHFGFNNDTGELAQEEPIVDESKKNSELSTKTSNNSFESKYDFYTENEAKINSKFGGMTREQYDNLSEEEQEQIKKCL